MGAKLGLFTRKKQSAAISEQGFRRIFGPVLKVAAKF
jgi:hypothetical protein